MQLWMCGMKWKIDIFSISFTFVLPTETSVWTCGSLVCLSMMKELCHVVKAFRTWVANKSEKDIVTENVTFAEFYLEVRRQHVFGWERWCLKCFHVFQTLKHVETNKPCLDVKFSRVEMRFCEFLWTLAKRCQHAAFIRIFVSRKWDVNRKRQSNRCRDFSCLRLCAVKVAELWDRLTWFVWTVLFLKDDVLVADPGR